MIILDASYLVKLVLEESGSDEARDGFKKAVEAGEEIASIDIALAESANAVWKHFKLLNELTESQYSEALKDLLSIWSYIHKLETRDVLLEASSVAADTGLTIYDSLYLAAAKKYGAKLYTFDERLRKLV